jgi:hypothetical protein
MVLVVSAGLIYARATPGQQCAVAKVKAAGKKFDSKLKCIEKALSTGAAVDSNCLTAADVKFNSAISKAEMKGGCAFTGDGPTFEKLADDDTSAIAAFADPNAATCCRSGPASCTDRC